MGAPRTPRPDVDGLVIDAPRDFRVHECVYTDADVFAAEMDRIFGFAWIYVAHESEIPSRGDYKTATIGREPVIVSRDDAGVVHVLLNHALAVEIARLPERYRGFGHVKQRNVAEAKTWEASLLATFRNRHSYAAAAD